ncbi:MAG: hypothetical protein WA755_09510 [Candidatus Acidiferrales bacterium]
MRFWKFGAAILAIAVIAGCSNSPTIAVTVAPSTATVVLNGEQQFTAAVTGTSTTTVTWELCTGAPNANPSPTCGIAALGNVDVNGLYTAPGSVPSPANVTVVATSMFNTNVFGSATITIDSGIRVKVIPASYQCTSTQAPVSGAIEINESFALQACVTGTSNTNVNWSVDKIDGGNSTDGFITAGGVYTAPSTSPGTVTITAISQQDQNESASFSLVIGAAGPPGLTAIDPMTVEQGSLFQDIYLIGQDFFSTSTVLVNGSSNDVTTTYLNGSTLRARLAAPLLQNAGSLELNVQGNCDSTGNNCSFSPALPLTLIAVRPGLISTSPVSVPQNSAGASTVTFTGGFYSPSTTTTFNGQATPASIPNNSNDPYNPDTRQLQSVLPADDFTTAGLFPLVVENAGVPAGTSSIAAINLAVSPTGSSLPTSAGTPVAVGNGPSAVAINTATNTAVVANTTDGTISLINLATQTAAPAIPVGPAPTGVAVDNLLNVALIANNGTNQASLVDLNTQAVTSICLTQLVSGSCPPLSATTPISPFSVGINPLTHRALIANQSTNVATVVDLSTTPPTVYPNVGGSANPVSTGASPQVAIVPRLNWAIVTPGGAGTITIVDLGGLGGLGFSARLPVPVATLTLTTSIQGVAIDTETNEVLLTDPDSTSISTFNALDNSVAAVTYQKDQVAAAINPLTNLGVTLDAQGNYASVFNLATQQLLGTVNVGVNPLAIAIDPTSDLAVVANQGGATVSIFSLGAVRALHITETNPPIILTSSVPVTLDVVGDGFMSGAVVRLDGTPVPTSSVPSSCGATYCRELVGTVPVTLLGSARRFVLDVQNPTADSTGSDVSNASDFTVIQPVIVGTSPSAVAVDTDRDLAIVTNSVSNDVSIVNLLNGTADAPISVGTDPTGVAVWQRSALAVVANNASNDFTVINDVDLSVVAPSPIANCSACLGPTAIAIDQDNGNVVATDNVSNEITLFSVSTLPSSTAPGVSSVAVDQTPLAVAIDPYDNLVAVTAAPPPQESPNNTVDIIDLSTDAISIRLTGYADPSGVDYDPSEDQFIVSDSLNNNVVLISVPETFTQTRLRVGINPTSVAANFQTSTLLTLNSASNTLSVVDLFHQNVQVMVPLQGATQFALGIDAKLNLAIVVDTLNNRVLLVPIPR